MVSVAITTYNGEKYIAQQINSIIEQSETVDEIIICDDCSTDHTIEEIRRIAEQSTVRIHLYQNKKNLGYIRNFYKAISLTNGDYIFLADQDDIWQKAKVEIMLYYMKKLNAGAICTSFEIIDKDGNLSNGNYRTPEFLQNLKEVVTPVTFYTLIYGNVAPGCTFCFNSVVKEQYLRICNEAVIHDYQLMLIAANTGSAYCLNKKLIKYRIHDSNSLGFSKKENKFIPDFRLKRKEPMMVTFLKQLKKCKPVKHYRLYIIMYYIRFPYLFCVAKRFLCK